MKFGTDLLTIKFEEEFIPTFDKWKESIFKEGLKKRVMYLISRDLEELENGNN